MSIKKYPFNWFILALVLWSIPIKAASYLLGVPPFLPESELKQIYGPLANYLSNRSGQDIRLDLAPNFPAYWQRMNSNDHYHMILDAAHLVDYRLNFLDHELLAKVEGQLSFTLVTREDNLVFDPVELTGKPVAALPLPSMGSVQLDELFPNPVRAPAIVEVSNAQEAIEQVRSGRATGAYIPTPMLGAAPDMLTVYSTPPFPHMGLTARADVPQAVRNQIRKALLESNNNKAGQEMLAKARIPGFEQAQRAQYDGLNKLLKSMWGYKGKN